jgi:hypothetical protein
LQLDNGRNTRINNLRHSAIAMLSSSHKTKIRLGTTRRLGTADNVQNLANKVLAQQFEKGYARAMQALAGKD